MRSSPLLVAAVGLAALATGTLMAGCSHSSGSGGSSSSSRRLVCTTTSTGCECDTVYSSRDENSITCDAASFPGTICCADEGWPEYGDCSCDKPESGCDQSSDGTCRCGDDVSGDAKRCSPPSGGICCQTTGESTCECRTNSNRCGSGETAVTACTAPAAKCSSGTKVTSCGSGSSSSTSSSSSSSSSGSSGGTCEPNTDYCSSDSDCKCGATCFATCASCDSYCGVDCTSMSDCDAFRPGYFSECNVNASGKGRCVQ